MRTAIYVRVSTEEQVQHGYSIRAQEDKLRDYVKVRDWELFRVFADEGISGKNIEGRPALLEMLEAVKNGQIENVLVFKIDRLTRSTKDLIDLVELFNQHRCAFNSLNESIDTQSATGRMFIKIIGIFAEFERENLVERVKIGNERKVKEGYTLGARTVSYGYNREKGQKIQSVNPQEADIVRCIFRLYVQDDMSMTGIASRLNQERIETKENAKWNTTTIRLILENSNYIGKVRYQIGKDDYMEADGKHEPIVSEQIFSQAQEKMARMKKTHRTKRPKYESYFSGIAVCAICGSKLTPKRSYKIRKNGEKYDYSGYRCIDSTKGLCRFSCTHAKLEEAFIQYIDTIQDFDDDIEIELEEPKVDTTQIDDLSSELERLNERKAKIMNQYVGEEISFEDYQHFMQIIKVKAVELESKIDELKSNMQVESSNIAIARSLKENWVLLDDRRKLEFLETFVKQIIVRKVNRKDSRYCDYIISQIDFTEE